MPWPLFEDATNPMSEAIPGGGTPTMPMGPPPPPPPMMGPQPSPGGPMFPQQIQQAIAQMAQPPKPNYGGPGPGSLPAPNMANVPQVTPYQPPAVQNFPTKRGATYQNIADAITGFQRGAQNANAQKQQKLAARGKLLWEAYQAAGQIRDPGIARVEQDKIKNAPGTLEAWRAAGIEIPGVTETKPGIGARIKGAITGVQPEGTLSMPKGQQPIIRQQTPGEQDAVAMAAATAAIDPNLRAGIQAGTIQKPAEAAKIEQQNQGKLSQQRATLARSGFKLTDDGDIVPMTADELSIPQQGKAEYDKKRMEYLAAEQEYKEAQTEFEKSKMDPNSPAYQMAAQRIKIAQQNVGLRQQALAQAASSLSMRQEKFNADYPVNPSTGERSHPTTQTKFRSETAQMVGSHMPDIKAEVDKLAAMGKLGPIAGRYEEFLVGTGGFADPAYAGLRTQLKLMQSGIAMMHGGARAAGSIQMMNYINDAIKLIATDPANAQAVLDAAGKWIDTYAAGPQGVFKQGAPATQGIHGQPGVPNGAVETPQKKLPAQPKTVTMPDGTVMELQGDGTYKAKKQ